MRSIIDFIIKGFQNILKILNTQFFSDFPVTYLQLILASVVIAVMIKLIKGMSGENAMYGGLTNYGKSIGEIRDKISNNDRKKQIVKGNNNE